MCLLQVALDKLFRFATSHVFETEVAGRMCADMCAAAAKVMYECVFVTLHVCIPYPLFVSLTLIRPPIKQCNYVCVVSMFVSSSASIFLLGPGVPLGVLACPILHLTSSLSSVGDRY